MPQVVFVFSASPIPEDFLQLQVAGLRKSQRAVHTFMSFFSFIIQSFNVASALGRGGVERHFLLN